MGRYLLAGVIAISLLSGPARSQPVQTIDPLWDDFGSRVLVRMCGGQPTCTDVQLVTTPTAINWSDAQYGIYHQLQEFDWISEPGPIYKPKVGSSFYRSYKQFVFNIDTAKLGVAPLSLTQKQRLSLDAKAIDRTAKARDAAWSALIGGWAKKQRAEKSLPVAVQTPIGDYLNNSQMGKAYQTASDRADQAEQDYVSELIASGFAGSVLTQAINGVDAPTATVNPGPTPPEIVPVKMPSYSSVPDRLTLLSNLTAGSGKDSWEIDWSKSDVSHTWQEIRGGGSGFYSFFYGKGGGGTKRESIDRHETGFHMKIDFPALATVDVSTPSWFDPSLIQRFGGGPFTNPALFGGRVPFGPNGLVKRRLTQMLIAYNPSITIKLNKTVNRPGFVGGSNS